MCEMVMNARDSTNYGLFGEFQYFNGGSYMVNWSLVNIVVIVHFSIKLDEGMYNFYLNKNKK